MDMLQVRPTLEFCQLLVGHDTSITVS
jgi:hypothetical protein